MKRRWKLLITVGLLLSILCLAGRNVGFFGGRDAAAIRHALDLKVLPRSLKIVGTGGESWTDYLFEADLSIQPSDIDHLVSGRNFESYEEFRTETDPYMMRSHKPFQINSALRWTEAPPYRGDVSIPAECTVFINEEQDRVFLRFTAD